MLISFTQSCTYVYEHVTSKVTLLAYSNIEEKKAYSRTRRYFCLYGLASPSERFSKFILRIRVYIYALLIVAGITLILPSYLLYDDR